MSLARIGVFLALLVGMARLSEPAFGQPEGSLLRPEWKPGDKSYIEIQQERTTKVRRIGGEQGDGVEESKHSETWGFACQVEAVTPEGGATLKLTFERVALMLKGPKLELSFDSDTDGPQDENVLRPLLTPLLGKTLTVEMDAEGHAQRVTGVDELHAALEAAKVDAELIKAVQHLLRPEWHTFIWNRIYAAYPFKVVRADDVWERKLGFDEEPLEHTYRYRRSQQRGDVHIALVAYSASRPEQYALPETVPAGETRHEFGALRIDGIGMLDRTTGRFRHVHERRDDEQRVVQKDANGTLNVTRTNTTLLTKNMQFSEEERRAQKEQRQKDRPAGPRDKATSRGTPVGVPRIDDRG